MFITLLSLWPMFASVLPLRVSPSWGIVRKVALILLRLGPTYVQLGGGGIDEIFGWGGGVGDDKFRVAGLTTDIEPAISFLLLLGFSTVIKSPN